MSKGPFSQMRGISDRELGGVLGNHAITLRGLSMAVTTLLWERRLLLLLHVMEITAVVYLLWP